MKKNSLTSFQQMINSEKKSSNNGAIILINRKNYNHGDEKIKTNKSFNKPIKYNIIINKQKQISDKKIINNNIKYFLSDNQKSESIKEKNNFRDNILVAKSQRIFNFFINKDLYDNKSHQNKYRYQLVTNPYNNILNNENNKINKIPVNKSNEYLLKKSSNPNLIRNFIRTQKFNFYNNNNININNKFENEEKLKQKINKRPHSIKYNHIKIQKNIKKINEIFDMNNNIGEKIAEQLSKYNIGKTLGKGAYAIVKLVTDKMTKIDYAMKIYKKNEIKDKVRKSCVNNEINILKKIQHENIIKLIEVIDLKDYILIIQELFLGISLGQYHKKYWKTEDLTKKKEKVYKIILTQIFSAFDYLHKNHIAHLDIKMDNILINEKLDIKIIDFGFASFEPKHSLNKFFGGTPNYMSPEIILKRPYISILSDIWSLGVLVFKLFCNEYPFKGLTEKDLYNSIKKGKYRIKCFVNYDVKKIINSMLVLEPNKRKDCDMLLKLPWFYNSNNNNKI